MKRSLSEMQREKPAEPFVLTVNPTPQDGVETGPVDVEFVNPKKLHWTKLAKLDAMGPAQAMSELIQDEDQFVAFGLDPEIDAEALEWVMGEWRTHYGLGSPGESGSSTSS